MLLLIGSYQANAQQNHYIYLQSAGSQPFYARVMDKSYSSTGSGYVIIPRLAIGKYTIRVGFPKNKGEDLQFAVNLDADAGFLLSKNGEGENIQWSLLNLLTLESVMYSPGTNKPKPSLLTEPDAFSGLLAGVVKSTDIIMGSKTDSIRVRDQSDMLDAVNNPEKTAIHLPAISEVIKWKDVRDKDGTSLVYIVSPGLHADTVLVFIPTASNVALFEKDSPFNHEANGVEQTKKDYGGAEVPDTKATIMHDNKAISNQCKSVAGMDDFLKLRKMMAAVNSDEAMLGIARKYVQAKCLTTEQVKNLGTLFLNDAGRYHFFDLCYTHVSDTGLFHTLEQQLTDPYFINRFKAMIR